LPDDRGCHGGLADATGADDRHETLRRKLVRDRLEIGVPSDDPCLPPRQFGRECRQEITNAVRPVAIQVDFGRLGLVLFAAARPA
jgi:hypothetical protein